MVGPAWTMPGSHPPAGRYPLAVERHIMRMAARLVPGVITVTPHARYYALHALVAAEVEARDLGVDEALDLLRRVEVAFVAVSYRHHRESEDAPRWPHGTDALWTRLKTGELDMVEASQPTAPGYVRNKRGFWAAYGGPETTLKILTPGSRPALGPRVDVRAVRQGLGDLLELASREHLDIGRLDEYRHLCLCQSGSAPDGRWLAKVLCEAADGDDADEADRDRRDTIRLVARVVDRCEIDAAGTDIGNVLAFGDFLTSDEIARDLAIGAAWRGALLRNYSVGAWRRLWSWLVNRVREPVRIEDLVDDFVAWLPDGTVGGMRATLPATTDPAGHPVTAEVAIRAEDAFGDVPARELAVLMTGAARVNELTGEAQRAFVGDPAEELGPVWLGHRLTDSADQSVRDFGRQLVMDMLARARRIALAKTTRDHDGNLRMPARLRELDGGWVFRTSDEGSGDVSLRLDQLTSVLVGTGVLEAGPPCWEVTTSGKAYLAQ